MSRGSANLLNLASRASKLERGQPVLTEDQRDLRAVLKLVLNEVPDHPAALDGCVCTSFGGQDQIDVGGGPASEAILDQVPRSLEGENELGCGARMVLVVLPAGVVERQSRHGRARDSK